MERRLRQRRADARVRLPILADSSLLSGHPASHVPRVAAAARRTPDLGAFVAKKLSFRPALPASAPGNDTDLPLQSTHVDVLL